MPERERAPRRRRRLWPLWPSVLLAFVLAVIFLPYPATPVPQAAPTIMWAPVLPTVARAGPWYPIGIDVLPGGREALVERSGQWIYGGMGGGGSSPEYDFHVLDLQTGGHRRVRRERWDHRFVVLADGHTVVMWRSERLEVWDLRDGRTVTLRAFPYWSSLGAVGIHPAGTMIAMATGDGGLTVRDPQTLRALWAERNASAARLLFSPDGTRLYCASSTRWKVRDASSGRLLSTVDVPEKGLSESRHSLSPDGRTVVSARDEEPLDRLAVWDVDGGTKVGELTGVGEWTGGSAISPRGAFVTSYDRDCAVRIWSLSDRRLLHTISMKDPEQASFFYETVGRRPASPAEQQSVPYPIPFAYLPDGRHALVGSLHLRVLDLETGRFVRTY